MAPGASEATAPGHALAETVAGAPRETESAGTMNDLLDVWTLSPGMIREHKSAAVVVDPFSAGSASAAAAAGFDGMEAEFTARAGSEAAESVKAVPHPVVAEMNAATVSILLRLKHAAMFEDFQVTLTEGGKECTPCCLDIIFGMAKSLMAGNMSSALDDGVHGKLVCS